MILKLNPGDVICPECKGACVDDRLGDGGFPICACSVCHGEGKLDWIENIVGKEKPVFGFDSTSFTCTNLTHQPKAFNPNDVHQFIKGMRNSNVLLNTEIPDMVIEEAAKKLADRIDADIAESYKKSFLPSDDKIEEVLKKSLLYGYRGVG